LQTKKRQTCGFQLSKFGITGSSVASPALLPRVPGRIAFPVAIGAFLVVLRPNVVLKTEAMAYSCQTANGRARNVTRISIKEGLAEEPRIAEQMKTAPIAGSRLFFW
jgi:hypothetical protein